MRVIYYIKVIDINMNLSKLMGNKKAAYAILERRTHSTGTSCINDSANVRINIETAIAKLNELKIKYNGENKLKGLYTDLCIALGLGNGEGDSVSQYGYFTIGDIEVSLRISNHDANANKYIENDGNYIYNLCVVVSSDWEKDKFKDNEEVLLDEYVYLGDKVKDVNNPIIKILNSLIGYLRTGEYVDRVGVKPLTKAFTNPFAKHSPKTIELYKDLKSNYKDLLKKNRDIEEVFTITLHNLSAEGEQWLNNPLSDIEYNDFDEAFDAAKKAVDEYKDSENEIVASVFGGEFRNTKGEVVEGEPQVICQISNKDEVW